MYDLSHSKPAWFVDDGLVMPIICAMRKIGRSGDEFTVPLCRGHHREVHRHGDEAAWWQQLGLNPAGAARSLWLETHPVPVEDSPADDVATATSHATRVAPER
jgi:hypothetical protein